MRYFTSSVQPVTVALCLLVLCAAAIASSAATPTPSVQLYPLQYVQAKAAAALVEALVKGSKAYPADDHHLVVVAPDTQRQSVVAAIVRKLDQPSSFAQSTMRLTTPSFFLADVLKNVVAVVHARYPQVTVIDEDSSSSLIFQGPDPTAKKALDFAKKQFDAISSKAGSLLTSDTYDVSHAVPYGLPTAGATAGTTLLDMAAAAATVLQSPYPDLKISAGPANNKILLQGSARSISAAKSLLAKIDVLPPQVELDVTIYGLEASKLANIGFNLPTDEISTTLGEFFPSTTPGGLPTIPAFAAPGKPVRSPLSFVAQIDLLNSEGFGKVLSHPTLIALSGRSATITAGENIPFFGFTPTSTGAGPSIIQANTTTSSVQLGTTLTMLPIVNDKDNSVTLYLNPSFSTFQQFTTQGLPETVTRSAQTTINVPSGQDVVITGLNQLSESDADGYLPPFHGHWFLSELFHQHSINKDQLDIVMVVKPTVLHNVTTTKLNTSPPSIPTLAPLFTPTPSPSPSS